MFCVYCGKNLPDGSAFCPNCGARLTETEPQMQYNQVQTPEKPAANPAEKDALGKSILTYAILGHAFGCTLLLSFLGLIFTCVSKGKVNKYTDLYGPTSGTATVGRILNIPGLIINIFMTVFSAIYFFVLILVIVGAM
ncbi:MAG: zinc-ribbon domain-containing protein [Clostridia bacterium]|nr:zinc-ribbon domain-containing protein [Clostridia bacterium]